MYSRVKWTVILRSAFVALFSLLAFAGFATDEVRFDRARLEMVTPRGEKVAFSVELAIEAPQRMRGLMQRKSMAGDHGMLFDFGTPQFVTMWMRNTILPLDMLFMNEKGEVRHVHENAVPFSDDLIASGEDVRYVLELNAGTVKRLGLTVGSRGLIKEMKKIH